MWNGLREICRREHLSIHEIATTVANCKPANSSLTAAIRVFIMAYFRAAATEDGHIRAGHGPGGSFLPSLVTKSLSTSSSTMKSMLNPAFHRLPSTDSRQ
jgi:predicted DNA-binding ribbon-helix-helix protein